MVLLYSIGIRFYYLLILIFSVFNKKAKLWVVGRRNWLSNLKSAISPNYPVAWFHCASLGEFEQGRPLIEAYRESHPGHRILLTFFSPSGYEVRKNYAGADYVCYLPLDTARNAKRFLAAVKPSIAIFVKYEFWYHHLIQLKKSNVPMYVVSAIFRPKQIFFKWYGSWYRRVLVGFNHIFVQNTASVTLLQSIGISHSTAAGDTRFDRVYATAQKAEKIAVLEEFCKGHRVLVAGSTWPKDEELIFNFLKTTPPEVKLVIAPHEIDKPRIDRLIEQTGLLCERFTHIGKSSLTQARVLVIDTIGVLSSAYSYANIAYVGGGFGAGIHNTLEPATFGVPILFGPNYNKFREARELIEIGAGTSIATPAELSEQLNILLSSPNEMISRGRAAREYIEENIGATDRILSELKPKKWSKQ
jgi:3-deoxy-D-manno-octulosonic-acid transferase